jgi:hypothetical protein
VDAPLAAKTEEKAPPAVSMPSDSLKACRYARERSN